MWYGILVLLLANALGSAINPTFVKIGLREIPVLTFSALRFIIAAGVFYPIFARSKKKAFDRNHIRTLVGVSLLFPMNIIFFGLAIQRTTVLMSQIFYAMVPLIVGFLSHFVLGDKLTRHSIAGAFISMAGIGFLISQSVMSSQSLTFGTPLGNALCIVAVLSWASYFALSKKLVHHYSPVTTSFFSFAFTAVLISIMALFEMMAKPVVWTSVSPVTWLSLVLVGVGGSAAMYFLMQVGIKRSGPFTASLVQYTGPLFASLTAIPLLGERVTPPLVIGGILILAGVFYATTYDKITNKS